MVAAVAAVPPGSPPRAREPSIKDDGGLADAGTGQSPHLATPVIAGAPSLSLRRKPAASSASSARPAALEAPPTLEHSAEESKGIFEVFSRFNRDKATWEALTDAAIYPLARDALRRCGGPGEKRPSLRCWSCGCSSGEEAYYLRMIWQRRFAPIFPEVDLTVVGTDVCAEQIERCLRGEYPAHSVQGMPADWQRQFFHLPVDGPSVKSRWARNGPLAKSYVERQQQQHHKASSRSRSLSTSAGNDAAVPETPKEGIWQLSETGGVQKGTSFFHQDATQEMPEGPFDIISSRYAVCLYMEGVQKAEVLANMVQRLRPGGFLVIGRKERLPEGFCKSHGLSKVPCRVEDEFCPYGPELLLEDIFIKDEVAATPGATSSSQRPETELADPRLKAATYTDYLKSSGQVPDWTLERERIWQEMRAQKMTDKSRRLLEKACLEGRRSDTEGTLISRMAKDFESRQERQRVREAKKEAETEDAALRTHLALSKEEAFTRTQSFQARLQQDLAQREATQKAQEAADAAALAKEKKRHRSRRRAPSKPSKGKRANSRDNRVLPEASFRVRGQQKAQTH